MTRAKNWENGDWFITYSGQAMEVYAPRPEQIFLKDIAHHLAHICRFGGAVATFYSVADHSVYVSKLVPQHLAKKALLHDAAEAYLGDVIKPLKNCLEEYERIEAIWEACIAKRFGLDSLKDPLIKRADIMAVQAERRDLLKSDGNRPWNANTDRFPPAEARCSLHGCPRAARFAFIERAKEVGL